MMETDAEKRIRFNLALFGIALNHFRVIDNAYFNYKDYGYMGDSKEAVWLERQSALEEVLDCAREVKDTILTINKELSEAGLPVRVDYLKHANAIDRALNNDAFKITPPEGA